MPNMPFPLNSDEAQAQFQQIIDTFRDLYEDKVGGTLAGDGMQISGDSLKLNIKSSRGLTITNGQLDIDVDTLKDLLGL